MQRASSLWLAASRTPHGGFLYTLCYFWVMLDVGTFHALLLVPFARASSLRGAGKKKKKWVEPAVFCLTALLPLAGWKPGFSANLQGVGEVVCQPGH